MDKTIDFYQKKTNSAFEIITDSASHLSKDLLDAYHIRTSQLSDELSQILKAGRDLLWIGSRSSDVSEELKKQNPCGKILCISAGEDTPARDLLLLKLSRLRAAGATLEESAAYFERHIDDPSAPASGIPALLWNIEKTA